MVATPKNPMSEASNDFVLPAPTGPGQIKYKTHVPTPEQLAVMGIESAEGIDINNPGEIIGKLGALMNYLYDIFEDPTQVDIIKRRLRRRDDQLTLEIFMNAFTDYIEEQTGFPTQEPSDSAPSPSSTGKRSTGRIQPGE